MWAFANLNFVLSLSEEAMRLLPTDGEAICRKHSPFRALRSAPPSASAVNSDFRVPVVFQANRTTASS